MIKIINELVDFAKANKNTNASKKIDKHSVKVSPSKIEFKFANITVCTITETQTKELFTMFAKPTSKKQKEVIALYKSIL